MQGKLFTKVFALIMLITMLLPAVNLPLAFADEKGAYKSTSLQRNSDKLDGVKIENGKEEIPVVNMPNVKIEQVNDFVDRKGSDVVGVLQKFGQPFMIALFIVGIFMTILGAVTKGSGMLKGLIVMILAVFLYAGINAAPEILDFGQDWLKE